MSISISNENKNTAISVSNEAKKAELTWAEADISWEEATGMTWAQPGRPITRESKNSLSVSNEAKN